MKKFHYVALLAAAMSVASVSGHASISGSCNNTASGFCNEFSGSAYKTDKVQTSCQRQGMKFLPGACPAQGSVGTCVVYKGKNTESRYRYYNNFPGFGIKPNAGVAAEAERQCSHLKGEWISN